MEKEVPLRKTAEKPSDKKHSAEKINNVILVQLAVCAFLIALVFITSKLSPSAFEFLKTEYNRIMSVDMSAQELFDSAKNTIQNVSSSLSETTEANPPAEETFDGEGGEDEYSEDTAIAVMSTLGKNKNITAPLHGQITSRYGYRTNPISGVYGLHTGLDIAQKEGTNIVAAYNGVVKDVGYGDKRGNYVLMEHADGTQTLYCHCSEILVDEYAVIRAGETIALVGNTGWSTGPHLHFEIRINGTSVDPLDYLTEKDGSI